MTRLLMRASKTHYALMATPELIKADLESFFYPEELRLQFLRNIVVVREAWRGVVERGGG